MKEEPPPDEISAGFEITPTGMTGKARSRALSGLDQLLGSIFAAGQTRIDHGNILRRARTDGERRIIDAAASAAVKELKSGGQFAERAIRAHFDQVLSQQDNKDAVAQAAIEDLRERPPTPEQSSSGEAGLGPDFLDRLSTYAAGASTEELRSKWGRVLAAEVRVPGTFSARVMRVVDELDQPTALLFEELNKHRLYESIPTCLVEGLSFTQRSSLVQAGLLQDSEFGLSRSFQKFPNSDLWFLLFGNPRAAAISLPAEAVSKLPLMIRMKAGEDIFSQSNGTPSLPVYALTTAAMALTEILHDSQEQALSELVSKARAKGYDAIQYRQEGQQLFPLELSTP